MRHIATFLFFVSSLCVTGLSQDLVLKSGDVSVNGDSVYLSGTKSTELIETKISVTNNRTTAVTLKIRKVEIQVVEGAECSFCWGECYTPAVMISPMAISIQPGSTDRNSFVADYRPFETEGTSIVRYTFYNPSDTTYQQSLTIFYQIGTSGIENGIPDNSVTVFPNPAIDIIRVRFSGSGGQAGMLQLSDVSGKLLLSKSVAAGTREISLPVAGLPGGTYFLQGRSDKNEIICNRKVLISR